MAASPHCYFFSYLFKLEPRILDLEEQMQYSVQCETETVDGKNVMRLKAPGSSLLTAPTIRTPEMQPKVRW